MDLSVAIFSRSRHNREVTLFWVKINEQSFGPVGLSDIATMLKSQRVAWDAPALQDGGQTWRPLRDYLELECEKSNGDRLGPMFWGDVLRFSLDERLSPSDRVRIVGVNEPWFLLSELQDQSASLAKDSASVGQREKSVFSRTQRSKMRTGGHVERNAGRYLLLASVGALAVAATFFLPQLKTASDVGTLESRPVSQAEPIRAANKTVSPAQPVGPSPSTLDAVPLQETVASEAASPATTLSEPVSTKAVAPLPSRATATAAPTEESLRTQFQALTPFFVVTFRDHIRQRYTRVGQRVILPPRWMKRGLDKFAVEAQFRGALTVGKSRSEGIFFQYFYTPEGWVLVDTNSTSQLKKASVARAKRWDSWGSAADWHQILQKLQTEGKGVSASRRVASNGSVTLNLKTKELSALIARLRRGDRTTHGVLARELLNPQNPYKNETLNLMKDVDDIEALFRLRDYVRAGKGEGPAKALALLGTSSRSDSFDLLLEFLNGTEKTWALETARYIGRFRDSRSVPSLVKWTKEVTSPSEKLIFIRALGDTHHVTMLEPLENFFKLHVNQRASKEEEEIVQIIADSVYAFDPARALSLMVDHFSQASEGNQTHFLEKFTESKHVQALPVVRKIVLKPAYAQFQDFMTMKLAALRFLQDFGVPEDVELLDQVISITQGDYGVPIRDAAMAAKKRLQKTP